MTAVKFVCGSLAVSALGAVALGVLLERPAPRPVSQRDLKSVDENVAPPRPRLSDPLEADRLDPRSMILYREGDLRQRDARELQKIRESLSKFSGSGQSTPPPRRHWLQ